MDVGNNVSTSFFYRAQVWVISNESGTPFLFGRLHDEVPSLQDVLPMRIGLSQ